MGNCKDCIWWNKYNTTCIAAEWLDDNSKLKNDEFGIYADASDDQGLTAIFMCGPLFGCIKFKIK